MHPACRLLAVLGLVVLTGLPADAAEEKARGKELTVEEVAAAARPSVVVITHAGRAGKRDGLGSGFVVSADGLIATNLHVIGEGRPVSVELADGSRHEAVEVHAFDRSLDLALIRIRADNLKPLELGDSDTLKPGQAVVALGNPLGLKHSVVAGVVSGLHEVEGRKMIQVAIPVEPGNSGGPLLDRQGRVHGLLTMKSLVTANLGFAMSSNALKALLRKPNPVAMSAWATIGVLDPREWKPLFGARWRQRAGRIQVEGAGTGFGGRSLCLWQPPPPDRPYEVAVGVKLDDESGAAGLVFCADGGDRCYGFYPTGGRLRLTRFDGPDVFTWKILREERSPHYRPGDWNTLKVRVEKGRLQCFVNDRLVIESDDAELTGGQVGLAKFRDTQAEFKRFEVGRQVASTQVPADVAARITRAVAGLTPETAARPQLLDNLAGQPASVAVLRQQARALEEQAARLRQLALAVHHKRVQDELVRVLGGKEEEIDLVHAALLLARLDNDELQVDAYRRDLDRMARELAESLPKDADEAAKAAALNKFLFTERGFHGSRSDYYSRTNSYLNEVLDDREGLPITLSVVYLELARRLGLKVVGVGLPGHFVVRHEPAKGEPQLIDVYERGKPLSREEAEELVRANTGRRPRDEHFAAVGKRAIISRMLHNLTEVARRERDAAGMLTYVNTLLALEPESGDARWLRARLRFQAGQREGAIEDANWLLENRPEGLDVESVLEFRQMLNRAGP